MNNKQVRTDFQHTPGHKPRNNNSASMRSHSSSRVSTVIKAMSNTQRLEILSHLINGKECSVSELGAVLKTLSQSSLSQHLGRMRRAKILKARRDSQMVYYSIDDNNVQQIMELLSMLYEGDPVLAINANLANTTK